MLLDALEAGDQFLRKIFFGLGPEQATGGSGVFFNLGGEFDKLLHVAADVVLGFGGEIDFFV